MLSGEQRGIKPDYRKGGAKTSRNTTHSTVSANCLFHFTRSKENLFSILQNEFYPRYSLENLNSAGTEILDRFLALPMVSFCDIPLSQIRDHVDVYGSYALGLTKEWACAHGVAPVLYMHPTALTSESMWKVFGQITSRLEERQMPDLEETNQNLAYFSFFIKQYEGKRYREGRYSEESVRFYDEREWRYLPPLGELVKGEFNAFLTKDAFDNIHTRDYENQRISVPWRLGFAPRYIKYVIIASETERLETALAIRKIKTPNHPDPDVEELVSRVLTMEQVFEDF